jgi:DNA polymerase-1
MFLCPAITWKEREGSLEKFKGLFADETKTWIGHNTKYDLLMLKWYGAELKGRKYSIRMLAHYLIDPDGKKAIWTGLVQNT